ncbi:MAG: hypothetical protein IJ428_02495 [Clostridia bacterium]|nr:hypothetical protein [Clostridia bacterium]
MSDLAKWGILIAVAVAVIALIVALPVTGMIDLSALTEGISQIAAITGYYLTQARGFLNNFVPPGYEWMLTASISWAILSRFLTWVINITSQAAHYIFK